MIEEMRKKTQILRHGLFAWLRFKTWWSFEGYDPENKIYFVLLLMQSSYTQFISLKIIDTAAKTILSKSFNGKIKTGKDCHLDVSLESKNENILLKGSSEKGWNIRLDSKDVSFDLIQKSEWGHHFNRLRTKKIDYNILQFIDNTISGNFRVNDRSFQFKGYGYYEHTWGIQCRTTIADWLHFWSDEISGVVMSCYYDSGTPHHYTLIRKNGEDFYLFSPAQFLFKSAKFSETWKIKSPDLELTIKPVITDRSVMKVPPVLSLVNIDYYEQLAEIEGDCFIKGERYKISAFGKYDHNFNKW